MVSKPVWIKTASHSLGRGEAKLILEDLDNKLIRVVRDTEALIGRNIQPNKNPASQACTPNTGRQEAQVQTQNQTIHHVSTHKKARPTSSTTAPKKKNKQSRRTTSLTTSELALDQSSEESSSNVLRDESKEQSSEEED
ncbi:hypothetical protein PCASD_09335 [Puccinia coronata f. sp. avenae]|uniref:Uncharacterized protein n=1 Tax=Puccinia coronata f. sp. avenae TaxID=200324 RepID=A0A2N5USM6_9BASI|nr:hypothetical protein PCASD_09335 [Puccinia coronata f. sp. avenae]